MKEAATFVTAAVCAAVQTQLQSGSIKTKMSKPALESDFCHYELRRLGLTFELFECLF